ncbi:THAP domain-containing protein 1-like [Gymnodraco acuticeps]|uniref:THAP domain-containing protein 1-like n=1 Tax=Gymnodraco acuticeps TaxID=8218 RepID=A0A6P8TAJ8_GYMAC|nr:THAP domain-containing protein 1-like [Gymnodraco acuticeps]
MYLHYKSCYTGSVGLCFQNREERRRQWEVALRRDGFVSCDRTLLCSEYFRSEDFDRTGKTVRLKDGVVPTIFNFPAHLQRPEATRSTTTSRRAEDEPQPNVVSILNVAKTREMVIDFRRVRTSLLPLCILDVAVVEDYKYLGVHLDNRLN